MSTFNKKRFVQGATIATALTCGHAAWASPVYSSYNPTGSIDFSAAQLSSGNYVGQVFSPTASLDTSLPFTVTASEVAGSTDPGASVYATGYLVAYDPSTGLDNLSNALAQSNTIQIFGGSGLSNVDFAMTAGPAFDVITPGTDYAFIETVNSIDGSTGLDIGTSTVDPNGFAVVPGGFLAPGQDMSISIDNGVVSEPASLALVVAALSGFAAVRRLTTRRQDLAKSTL